MRVLIIGNGISGITAARTLRKNSDCEIFVVSEESPYFFSRTALMYVYMGHMKFEHIKPYEDHFWEKNKINLIQDRANSIDFSGKSVKFNSGSRLIYDKLLLATGSVSNKLDWPGHDLRGVQGLYSYQDLENLEANTHPAKTPSSKQRVKQAVIVGGGLIGMELAEMLLSREIQVTMLIREKRYWGNILPEEESKLVMRNMNEHGVNMKLNCELNEVLGDRENRVRAVVTGDGEEIPCQFTGLTTGVRPNIAFLAYSPLETKRGILVNSRLETSIADVYAAGDCAEMRVQAEGRKSIEQIWYTGRTMGEVAGLNILGRNTEYNPGPWFNSAKFFDIEYQTYGNVGSELKENETGFYWENEKGNKCVRIVSDKQEGQFIGINLFGIRMRHALFDLWLRQGRSTDFVLQHFRDASFEPEFVRDEIPGIIKAYNEWYKKDIILKKKEWKRILA